MPFDKDTNVAILEPDGEGRLSASLGCAGDDPAVVALRDRVAPPEGREGTEEIETSAEGLHVVEMATDPLDDRGHERGMGSSKAGTIRVDSAT